MPNWDWMGGGTVLRHWETEILVDRKTGTTPFVRISTHKQKTWQSYCVRSRAECLKAENKTTDSEPRQFF